VGTVAPAPIIGTAKARSPRGGIRRGRGTGGRFCGDRATAPGCAGRVGHAGCTPPARGVNGEGASKAGGLGGDSGDGPSPASRLMFKHWAPVEGLQTNVVLMDQLGADPA
jgi:hypothetical protein